MKGMGLRPKVELVGQETIISADMSVINDENLKRKFLNIIKMQVIENPANVGSHYSTSDTSASSKKPACSPHENELNHRDEGRRTSRKSLKPMDVLPPGPFKPEKPGEPLPPGLFKRLSRRDSRPSLDLRRASELNTSSLKRDSRPSLDQYRTPALSQLHYLPPCKKSAVLKAENLLKSNHVLEIIKRILKGAGAGYTVVGKVVRQTSVTKPPVSVEIQRGSLPPGPFKPEHPGEDLPPGLFKPRKTLGADDLPPVPWAPKKKKPSFESKPRDEESTPDIEKESTFGGRNKRGVNFAMHQKQYTTPNIDFWNDYPSNQLPSHDMPKSQVNDISKKKKTKKLRIMKHLRRWLLKGKKIATPCVSSSNVVKNHSNDSRSNVWNSPCGCSKQEHTPANHSGVKSAQSSQKKPRILVDNNFNIVTGKEKQTSRMIARKPVETFDGSISMPVLITPDQSCFKAKRPTTQELADVSKSSTRAGGSLEEGPTSYSVVGDSAAIHIAKNRIRLEGNDVKYGSILHKDKHFDDHFKVLEENSLQDIESQVNKVKERIMFARAIDSVGAKMSEDAAPEVDLKALLWPDEKGKNGKTKKNQVDVVTKSSFYQKFLASMNILKCTNRTDACDRSVMTDEPLSRTYAEFISATKEMTDKNRTSYKKKRKRVGQLDATSTGDSSCDLESGGYMSKICQCWEPLLPSSKRDQAEKTNRKFEPYRSDDEKILRCLVNKVIDKSRNQNKGYIKTQMTQ